MFWRNMQVVTQDLDLCGAKRATFKSTAASRSSFDDLTWIVINQEYYTYGCRILKQAVSSDMCGGFCKLWFALYSSGWWWRIGTIPWGLGRSSFWRNRCMRSSTSLPNSFMRWELWSLTISNLVHSWTSWTKSPKAERSFKLLWRQWRGSRCSLRGRSSGGPGRWALLMLSSPKSHRSWAYRVVWRCDRSHERWSHQSMQGSTHYKTRGH